MVHLEQRTNQGMTPEVTLSTPTVFSNCASDLPAGSLVTPEINCGDMEMFSTLVLSRDGAGCMA